jgi:DDE superfamily endonuclease
MAEPGPARDPRPGPDAWSCMDNARNVPAPPINWRLFLPQSWDADAERRRKAHVPQAERHRPTWQLALAMLDELAGWDLAPPVLLADAASGEAGEVRLGLEQHERAYVVQVPGTLSADAQDVAPEAVPHAGRGRPPVPRSRQRRWWLRQLVGPLARGSQHGSPGARAPTARCLAGGWWRCGCARPGSGCAAPPAVASCRWAGCWPSGQPASPSQSPTGWPACPPTRPCSGWWAWPGCAGGWSTMTGNCRTRWGWTTSRAAPSRAGTIT